MSQEPRLEEQAISQVVEKGLASQLSDAEDLEVQVQTDLLKAVQGKADAVSIAGKGVTIQPDVRVEAVELHTDRISVNPLSAVLGQIKLDQPISTEARIVLTEDDLNRAFNSSFVRDRLTEIPLEVNGETVTVAAELPMSIDLQTRDRMGFVGTLLLDDPTDGTVGKRRIGISAILSVQTADHPVLLESFCCTPGQGVTLPFAIAIMQKALTLIQSPYLEIGGMALRVRQMAIEPGLLILEGAAQVSEVPQL